MDESVKLIVQSQSTPTLSDSIESKLYPVVPSLKKEFAEVGFGEDSVKLKTELEEIISSDEYRKSHLSPRLEEFRNASDQSILNLERCFLGTLRSRDVRWLARFMTLFPTLRAVNLKCNNLSCLQIDMFISLMIGLKSLHTLEELIISCNRISHDLWRWEQWCDLFRTHSSSLRQLNLANNNLGIIDDGRMNSLDSALIYCHHLESINLANNQLGMMSRFRFGRLLNSLRCLPKNCEIDLSWNSFDKLNNDSWMLFLNFASKFYGRLIIDHNSLDKRQEAELVDIYRKRSFEGKTGGKLYTLVARTIWARPDLFEYDEEKLTLNEVELLDDVHSILQSQSSVRRC